MVENSQRRRFTLLLAGWKGAIFLKYFADSSGSTDVRVFSYSQEGISGDPCAEIQNTCELEGYSFFEKKHLDVGEESQVSDFVICVGWQFLIPCVSSNLFVFHDSYLPEFKGFAPSVTALILGRGSHGVTLFRPTEEVDSGEILAQVRLPISYPCRIVDLYHQVCKEAVGLLSAYTRNELAERQIPAAKGRVEETYSIWRDEQDYHINWCASSQEIARFVDALSWPYLGALTYCNDEPIRILEVSHVDRIKFENRQPGKIWQIKNGKPYVLTGDGLLCLEKCVNSEGQIQSFSRLRQRFT